MTQFCQCGCGQEIKEDRKFLKNHDKKRKDCKILKECLWCRCKFESYRSENRKFCCYSCRGKHYKTSEESRTVSKEKRKKISNTLRETYIKIPELKKQKRLQRLEEVKQNGGYYCNYNNGITADFCVGRGKGGTENGKRYTLSWT